MGRVERRKEEQKTQEEGGQGGRAQGTVSSSASSSGATLRDWEWVHCRDEAGAGGRSVPLESLQVTETGSREGKLDVDPLGPMRMGSTHPPLSVRKGNWVWAPGGDRVGRERCLVSTQSCREALPQLSALSTPLTTPGFSFS